MGSTRTQVAVIGAGPAGLTLANLLRRKGISCVLIEQESRAFIERRPRAGFIEESAVRALQRHGLADRLLRMARTHSSFEFRFDGAKHVVNYQELSGHCHFVYPQQELVTDLVALYTAGGGDARFEVRDVRLHGLETTTPTVTFDGGRIECDFVAGCDGARGVSQGYVPASLARHDYGVGWLALLAQAPPSSSGVIFGIHPRGFAGHMARTASVTRFYLQCSTSDTAGDWPDDRVWEELRARLTVADGAINEGTLLEKRVLDMHNYVLERMSHGRLYLAGESAHLIAPIAAKGLNLAVHDALLLAEGIAAHYDGDRTRLDGYSDACLARVWQFQEFSQWLSDVFHGSADPFMAGLAQARLRRLLGSRAAAVAFAEIFIGKDADF
jgi:p-hydroxybenzoate 3-monooxygenase